MVIIKIEALNKMGGRQSNVLFSAEQYSDNYN